MPERENAEVISFLTVVLNAQSTGTVTISSSDPKDDPVVDSNYLSHPYDQRVAIEGLRSLLAFSNVSTFQAQTEARIEGPDGEDDEALLEHAKRSVQPVWHFGGTCRMGKVGDGDESWVVDREFRVRGVEGLKVVDLSVMPLMINNHTQATAYLVVSLFDAVCCLCGEMMLTACRVKLLRRRLLTSTDFEIELQIHQTLESV